jgi:serine-type D-Ala-D-Ala carboxypeptidase (penicillin-binding protein 5/6)
VKLNYTGPLMAPVEKGAKVGTVRVLVDGKTVAETPVLASETIQPITSMWAKALDSVLIMVFGS